METTELQQMSAREAFNWAKNNGHGGASGAKDAPQDATGAVAASESDPSVDADNKTSMADRIVHDTVSLSQSGQKIVNLGRGQELAATLKDAPVDATFADSLKKATQDVFRVMELFTQSIRSAFTASRG